MAFGKRFSADKKLKPQLKMAGESLRTASKDTSAALEQKMYQVAVLLREDPPKMEKAKIRTELVIRDENLIEAYEILRLDCELLVDSIQLIKRSPSCPPDLLLNVSRLLYASNRISSSNVPELGDIRDQFLIKYGQRCIDSVEKNIQSSKVHQHIVSKLSIDPPPEQALIYTYLKRICDKYEINRYSQQSINNRNIEKLQPMAVPMAVPMALPVQQHQIGLSSPIQAGVLASSAPSYSPEQQRHYNDAAGTKNISYSSNRAAATTTTTVKERPENLPRPSKTTEVDMNKPVKVFILMGQSNMIGYGKINGNTEGCLDYTVQQKQRFTHLMDENGNWTKRKNVRNLFVLNSSKEKVAVQVNSCLQVDDAHNVGIEMQFGSIMGELYGDDQPILLLKACIGNRSLGWDLLPSGSDRFPYDGKIYAGYGDFSKSWEIGSGPDSEGWYAGKQYDRDLSSIQSILSNLAQYYPGAQSYEISGFLWWQGHKDTFSKVYAEQYEKNLAKLITSLRSDLNAAGAKFVAATIAHDGAKNGLKLRVAEAQLAINDPKKYSHFVGNATTVDVRESWRGSGPFRAGPHYHGHAEVYMEVGNDMGWAMRDLLVENPTQSNIVIPGTQQSEIIQVQSDETTTTPYIETSGPEASLPYIQIDEIPRPSDELVVDVEEPEVSLPYIQLDEIPRPSNDLVVNMEEPVKVFILIGDYYMRGTKNTDGDEEGYLEYAIKEKMRFKHLLDDDEEYTERKNVRHIEPDNDINQYLSAENLDHIGCEIQFGSVIGEKMKNDPVLIIKAPSNAGTATLGYHLLPPGSEQYEYEGSIYAGYKDNFKSYEKESTPEELSSHRYAGYGYDQYTSEIKHVLDNIEKYYPGATSYEIKGFVWWQGLKEGPNYAHRYETNLVNLIKALRTDFNSPQAKFVCATRGTVGTENNGTRKAIIEAQKSVGSNDGDKYKLGVNMVQTIDTELYWDSKRATQTRCSHAEVYMETGDAIGRAMANLLDM